MKPRSIVSLLIFLLFVAGCAAPAPPSAGGWPTRGWATSTPQEQGMDARLLDEMLARVDADRLNLHALLVIRHGAIVLEKYYPGHSRDEQHELFSVTKSFVVTLFGIAVDQGKITLLDRPLEEYFPAAAFQNPDPRKDAITLENMLTMTSGLAWQEGDPTYSAMYRSPDWVSYVMGLKMETAPGETFNYCSGCSHILLKVLEQATGAGAIDYARKYLFEPLGIRDFSWERTPQGDAIGGWGLTLTARDMAKLGYLYLHEGMWDGQQIVSSAWVRAATLQHADPDGRMGYGYQWWIYDTHGAYAALGHAGQTVFVIPDLDVIVVTTADIPNHDPIYALIDEYVIPAAGE